MCDQQCLAVVRLPTIHTCDFTSYLWEECPQNMAHCWSWLISLDNSCTHMYQTSPLGGFQKFKLGIAQDFLLLPCLGTCFSSRLTCLDSPAFYVWHFSMSQHATCLCFVELFFSEYGDIWIQDLCLSSCKNRNVVEPRQIWEGWDFKLYPDYTLLTKNILLITEIADVHPQNGIPRVLL